MADTDLPLDELEPEDEEEICDECGNSIDFCNCCEDCGRHIDFCNCCEDCGKPNDDCTCADEDDEEES